MKDLKILFVARRYPPSVGGMQRFAFELAQALKTKTRVDVVAWGGSNKWLTVVVLPWLFLQALYRVWFVRGYDLIHIQDAATSPIGWLLHKLSGKPYVVVAHGLDVTYQNFLYRPIPWFVRRATKVISISQATAQAVGRIGVGPERTVVINLGIDDPVKGISASKADIAKIAGRPELDEASLLLTIGRLEKRKGTAWFIKNVLPQIIKEYPRAVYIVAGDGSERPVIETVISELRLESSVVMLGRVSDDDKLKLYRACELFIMPNIKIPGDLEGFGIVAQEAAASGLPVVASNLEGINDALQNGKNGILVEQQNADQFIKEISKLLGDEAYRQKFGQSARRYTLDNFQWPSIAQKYLEVYDQILKP